MIVLTVIFALITLWAFRARGAAAGIRGLAVTLLPAAAWLTGSLDLFTGIGNAMVDWARATVRTNQVWGGIGAFAAAVLLWLIGTRMRTSAVARARSAKREKDSHMATAVVAGPAGSTALLGFTSMAAMQAWQPTARPMPVSCREAAESAVAEGADALVIDLACEHRFVLTGTALAAIAQGWRLVRVDGELSWVATTSA